MYIDFLCYLIDVRVVACGLISALLCFECSQQQVFVHIVSFVCNSLMVSRQLEHATARLQAHTSLKHCDRPRPLPSTSTIMVTAIVYAIVAMMDLIWLSLRRLSAVYNFFIIVNYSVSHSVLSLSSLQCCRQAISYQHVKIDLLFCTF